MNYSSISLAKVFLLKQIPSSCYNACLVVTCLAVSNDYPALEARNLSALVMNIITGRAYTRDRLCVGVKELWHGVGNCI